MEIISATAEMADDIAEIGFASWNAAYAGIVPGEFLVSYTPGKRAAALRRALVTRTEEYEYYLFRNCGAAVGYAIIGPPQGDEAPKYAGEIHAVYFVQDSWGKGLAGEAMSFCIERLKLLGYESVVLWVLEDNMRARSFYQKHGFSDDGHGKEINIGKPLFEIRYFLDFSRTL